MNSPALAPYRPHWLYQLPILRFSISSAWSSFIAFANLLKHSALGGLH